MLTASDLDPGTYCSPGGLYQPRRQVETCEKALPACVHLVRADALVRATGEGRVSVEVWYGVRVLSGEVAPEQVVTMGTPSVLEVAKMAGHAHRHS